MRHQRPALTLLLMLAAAGLMLAGGVWLARRAVEERVPVDRTLLRETAAILQEELSRLDAVFTGHLRNVAALAENGAPLTELRAACENLRGPELIAILPRGGGKGVSIALPSPGSIPPNPELVEGRKRASSPFAFALSADQIFTPAAADSAEGWTGKPGDNWLAWWRRLPGDKVAVILVRGKTVEQTVSAQLEILLTTAWAPARAAGGIDRVESGGISSRNDSGINANSIPSTSTSSAGSARTAGGGTFGTENARRILAKTTEPPDRAADFIVPLTSRLGSWQIISWDRRIQRTEFDIPTLTIAGTLAIGIALLGWRVAAAQRAALREVTARVSFVNRVSHELSAPLTNLQLSLDLADDALDSGSPDKAAARLAIAREETARLARMVANVLTFARKERGQAETLHPETCRPAALVQRVLDQFAPALTRRGITVETHFDLQAEAHLDPDAFSQITANLLSNVEKYAASGQRAVITLTNHPRTNARDNAAAAPVAPASDTANALLRLTVRDFGPGIPPAQAEHIFQPFERLDHRITEGVTGTGLGLAIARDLAERMSGKLTLLPPDPDNPGATFELTLPTNHA